MLTDVAAVVDGVAMTPVEAPERPAPVDPLLQLARVVAARRFEAVQQLCPGWRNCHHHQRLVGRAFMAALALSIVGPGPRAYVNVAGDLVPSWS